MTRDDAPDRIWIEEDDGCPYFYDASELAEAGGPLIEYIRADLAAPAPVGREFGAELSGNTGGLIDKMAEAIRGDTTSDDTPWAVLSEDRKIGWRGDAERALAAVKEYLTAHSPAPVVPAEGLAAELSLTMSRYDAAAPQDDETCTGCYGSGWDGNAERFCHCLDGISARKAQEAVQEPPSPGVTAGVTGDTPIGGRVRFAVPAGRTWNDMREWLHTDPKGQSLHQHGDCLLVWANEDDLFATPAPVVPAEGLDSERLVAAWLAETEGFASRQERLMDDILAECDLAPWLHAACQVGIDAALRSAQPVEARVRPLAAIFDAAKAEAALSGSQAAEEGAMMILTQTIAERDAARKALSESQAREAMWPEVAAKHLDPEHPRPTDYDRNKKTAYDAGYYDARRSDAAVVRALASALRSAPPVGARVSIPSGLIDALRSQRQIDADGCEVAVSRQACDEAAAILAALLPAGEGE